MHTHTRAHTKTECRHASDVHAHTRRRFEFADFGDGIIDIYSTNLVKIPLNEAEIADAAYYDVIGECLG